MKSAQTMDLLSKKFRKYLHIEGSASRLKEFKGCSLKKDNLKKLKNQDGPQYYNGETTAEKKNKGLLKQRKELDGHFSQVCALNWSTEADKLVTASRDGYVIVWEPSSGYKLDRFQGGQRMTCCAIAHSGNFITSGGLDDTCSVFRKHNERDGFEFVKLLKGHKAHITGCEFINNHHILTSSEDKTCILWNVAWKEPVRVYQGHRDGVTALDMSPNQRSFVSCGYDALAKNWDIRDPVCTHTRGYDGQINCVQFLNDGQSFVTGSADGICKLFDMRNDQSVATFYSSSEAAITSLGTTAAGRLLFASNDTYGCDVWDMLTGKHLGVLPSREIGMSCIGLPPDGSYVASGSSNGMVKIWR